MKIVRATIEDANVLSILAKKTFFDTFTGTCTADDMDNFLEENYNKSKLEQELSNVDDYVFLAKINDENIAYIRFREDYSGFDELKSFKSLELNRLYVQQEFKGKGIAQELINFMNQFAIENSYNLIWLGVWEHNERAKNFYIKNGFINTGYSHPFPIGNIPQTDLWFWRMLN